MDHPRNSEVAKQVGPREGDAFGEMLKAAYRVVSGTGVHRTLDGRRSNWLTGVLERDDGFLSAFPALAEFAPEDEWPHPDRLAVDSLTGRVLDIGVGGGRVALPLQRRGIEVTGIDTSPGAVEVARERGLRSVIRCSYQEHATSGQRYDSLLLLGNGLSMIGSRENASSFFGVLANLATTGALLVGTCIDPHRTASRVHHEYYRHNESTGRLAGQMRVRYRYRELATGWFDWLFMSPSELAGIVRGTGWELLHTDNSCKAAYLALLRYG